MNRRPNRPLAAAFMEPELEPEQDPMRSPSPDPPARGRKRDQPDAPGTPEKPPSQKYMRWSPDLREEVFQLFAFGHLLEDDDDVMQHIMKKW